MKHFCGLEKRISLKTAEGKIITFTVNIPKGIKQGEKIRLIGQGKHGKNGGNPGDLIIKINIQNDSKFQLKGDNIHTILKITPWEAALGKRIDISSIDNEVNKVYIPQGTQSGDIITIPGKGYEKEDGKRGNLIAEVRIMLPKRLTSEEKSIFEKLDKLSNFNPREA